jgi:RNA polymerase-binding transcription factor
VDTAIARKRLEEIRDDIDRSIAVLKGEHEGDGRATGFLPDPADAGANLSEADRSEAVIEAAASQRRRVIDALDRIDHGAYGLCVDCGDAVPEGRLEARPDAARCVRCQSKYDRQRR